MASPQNPGAAVEVGTISAIPAEPVRGRARVEGGGWVEDTWRRQGSGSLACGQGPVRPLSLETLCLRPHLLPGVLASSGWRREEKPGAHRRAPSSAHSPSLAGSPRAPPAALVRRTPRTRYPDTDPRAPAQASLSAPPRPPCPPPLCSAAAPRPLSPYPADGIRLL